MSDTDLDLIAWQVMEEVDRAIENRHNERSVALGWETLLAEARWPLPCVCAYRGDPSPLWVMDDVATELRVRKYPRKRPPRFLGLAARLDAWDQLVCVAVLTSRPR